MKSLKFVALLALAACGVEPEQQLPEPGVTVLDGFVTARGEEISFIVSEDEHGVPDIIVRSKHSADMASEIMPLTHELTPLELWMAYNGDLEPPAILMDHYLAIDGVVLEAPAIDPELANAVTETRTSGEGDCSNFVAGYTWTWRYTSPVVTAGVTANLSDMENFVTGACNRSTNSATETLFVELERWTSAISGWSNYYSETIWPNEAVEYSRTLTTCSYYEHRLVVLPSSASTYYRYAGQWADVSCGGIVTP